MSEEKQKFRAIVKEHTFRVPRDKIEEYVVSSNEIRRFRFSDRFCIDGCINGATNFSGVDYRTLKEYYVWLKLKELNHPSFDRFCQLWQLIEGMTIRQTETDEITAEQHEEIISKFKKRLEKRKLKRSKAAKVKRLERAAKQPGNNTLA